MSKLAETIYFGSFIEEGLELSSGEEESSSRSSSVVDTLDFDFSLQTEFQKPKACSLQRPRPGRYGADLETYKPFKKQTVQNPSNTCDEELVCFLIKCAVKILTKSPTPLLKAVELANSLKRKIGTKQLGRVKELFGGLLFLLEKFPRTFIVHRIPKNDTIQLTCNYLAASSPYYIYEQTCEILPGRSRAPKIPFLDIDQLISEVDVMLAGPSSFHAPTYFTYPTSTAVW